MQEEGDAVTSPADVIATILLQNHRVLEGKKR